MAQRQNSSTRPRQLIIFSDFDGTISIPDSVEFLLERFASQVWKDLDDLVWKGRLSEREAMAKQVAMLDVDWSTARSELLNGIGIREGFPEFVEWCREAGISLKIVSSGLRLLIDCILEFIGVTGIEVYANNADINATTWRFLPYDGPRHGEHCSHCKCDHLFCALAEGLTIAYIGDGYTDVCPSAHAHIVFATDSLARECDRLSRSYYPYSNFHDVRRTLDSLPISKAALK